MTFATDWQKQQEDEDAQLAEWALGDYASYPCPNCGRERLCKCLNGKHRCDKCNWVPEDDSYCPIEL